MELKSILIVEDEDYLREEIAGALERKGYHVVSAPDGKAALIALETMTTPCLILVDLMMPNMDGWELLEKVRELSVRTKLAHRALVMSGASAAQDIAHQQGADFLSKPFRVSELFEKISKY